MKLCGSNKPLQLFICQSYSVKMFGHIKNNLLHLPKLQYLCSFLPELAVFQIFIEDIKVQHSYVTKQRHFQSLQSPSS
jgi:hypothetical protein